MLNTYAEIEYALNQAQEITDSIARINALPYLDYREKVRLTIQQGINLLKYRIELLIAYNLADANDPTISHMQFTLNSLAKLEPYSLLEDEQVFADFAAFAYYCNEFPLICYCVTNGVRLVNNEYFTKIFHILEQYPDYYQVRMIIQKMLGIENHVVAEQTEPVEHVQLPSETEQSCSNVQEQLPDTTRPDIEETEITRTKTTTIKSSTTPKANMKLTVRQIFDKALQELDAPTINNLLTNSELNYQICLSMIINTIKTLKSRRAARAQKFISLVDLPIEECVKLISIKNLQRCSRAILVEKLLQYDTEAFASVAAKYDLLQICAGSMDRKIEYERLLWGSLRDKVRAVSIKNEEMPTVPEEIKSATNQIEAQAQTIAEPQTATPVVVQTATSAKTKNPTPSTAQQLSAAISNFNTAEFNALLATHPKLNKIHEIDLKLLSAFPSSTYIEDDKLVALRDFLLEINIRDENVFSLILNKDISLRARLMMLPRIMLCDNESLFICESKHKIGPAIAELIENIEEEPFRTLYLEIMTKISLAYDWANTRSQELFNLVSQAQPGANVEPLLKQFESVLNQINSQNQTVLMAAFVKGLSKATILYLIEKSDDSIYAVDKTHSNVFHYWARHLNSNSADIIAPLWNKFKQQTLKTSCVLGRLNSKTILSGSTFMHILVQNPDHKLITRVFERMFSLDNKLQFNAAILVKNFAGDTPVRVLQKQEAPNTEMINFLLKRTIEIVVPLCLQYVGNLDYYFPPNTNFFTTDDSSDGDIVHTLIANNDFATLVPIINMRNSLRLAILLLFHEITANKIKPGYMAQYEAAKQQVLGYFGQNEFKLMHEGKNTFDNFTDFILEHPEHESLYRVDEIKITEQLLPFADCLDWKKIHKHFSNIEGYTLSAEQLKDCIKLIEPKINELDITGKSPLDYAIISRKPALVQFMMDNTKAEITDRVACNAICYSPDDNIMTIADMVIARHKTAQTLKWRLQYSHTLMSAACLVAFSPTLVKWLIAHDFSTNTKSPHTNQNLLQVLIAAISNANFDTSMELIKALLSNKSQVTSMLLHTDPKGHSCLHYVQKLVIANITGTGNVSQDNIDKLFEVLLEHGAPRDLYEKITRPNKQKLGLTN